MNHIKLFEHYHEYYTEIPGIISQNLISTDRIKFKESEYKDIINIIDKRFGKCRSILGKDCIELIFGYRPGTNILIYRAVILKYPDEWFYLTIEPNRHWDNSFKPKFFKCDQFDGLLKCLNSPELANILI